MPKPIQARPSSDQIMQTLVWMRKQGFKPVALHHRSKAATSRTYTALDYVAPNDDLWRHNEYGLGCVTGPRHSGPIDIDLDCIEALFFAPKFLPPTEAVFGRASKPRSHWLYRTDADGFEKRALLDPVLIDNNTIVEMRGDNGHQTVFPGSLHEATGELIEWQGGPGNVGVPFPEVTTVPAVELNRATVKIGIATLIVRHIWLPGFRNEPCKHLAGMFYYLEWTEDETVQLIEAVMEYVNDRDKSRIPTVRATFRRAREGKKVSGAGVLRKQLGDDRVVDRLLELAGNPTINVLQDYNERFAVVAIEGKFRIADLDVTAGETPTFYMKDDFLNLMGVDLSDLVNEQGKKVPKPRLWLAHSKRRTYLGADFMPGVEDSNKLNLWTGWAIQPSTEGSCNAWLDLLHEVNCSGDDAQTNWLLHWFANIVREPMNKSLTAPVLIGPEGAGKSLLLDFFGAILGPCYIPVTNEEHIYGRFNKHLASSLLLHSEEALYAGDRKHAGIIRSLITDKFRIYEQKGIDARRVRNYLRLVLTSNELHAAPAKPGDRRYSVFNMGERAAGKRLSDAVVAELEADGPARLFQHLLDMDYDPMVPRVNLKNDSLISMKRLNMAPLEAWWLETLMNGEILPDYLNWAQSPEKDDWPEIVSSKALNASMTIYCRQRGTRSMPNENLMAAQLDRFVGRGLARMRRRFSDPLIEGIPEAARNLGERQYAIVNMPPLDDCRAAFEKYLGQTIDWPKDDDDQEPLDEDKF